jgi:hypothetical protein
VAGFYIHEIVLVFSQFKKAENFKQAALNQSRWENLMKLHPALFSTGNTLYHSVCQSGVITDSAAKKLTHGFYIYFENRSDDAKRQIEVNEIAKMITSMGIDTSAIPEEKQKEDESLTAAPDIKRPSRFRKPLHTIDPKTCRQPFYGTGTDDLERFFREHLELSKRQERQGKKLSAEIKLTIDFNGVIRSAHIMCVDNQLIGQVKKALVKMDLWNPAVRNGVTIKTDVRFTVIGDGAGSVIIKRPVIVARMLAECGTAPNEEIFDFSEKSKGEKLIPSVFEVQDKAIIRNAIIKEPKMDSMLIVVDVTGSMGPYIAQVLDLMSEIIANNDPFVACISLFNDGDGKPDRDKKIGNTGGITILDENITVESLSKKILECMKKGNGGDVMENNLEATLKALDKCRNCKDVVMIADNFATPRDKELIGRIGRPVHWVLCGVYEEINVHYLDLVRANKGFLHTGKSDHGGLHLINEGDSLQIDGYTYQLKNGKFRLIR